MRSLLRLFLTLSILGIIVIAASYAYFIHRYVDQPGPATQQTRLIFPHGTSVSAIAKDLEANGLITHAIAFKLAYHLLSQNQQLHAGEYQFESQASIRQILSALQSRDVFYRQFTIPEGYTAKQVVPFLNEVEGLKGDTPTILEGSILPETYRFTYGETRADLVVHMRKRRQELWQSLWSQRDAAFALNQEEANILASIVQEEAGNDAEMPIIAGVFTNRLARNMKLQTDPTVIYAITEGLPLGRPLSRKDLKTESPYNTYIHRGLPPTPIANPGEAAIRATLQPAQTDALYFVADGTGGHAFGKTLDEHNENVRAYRKWLKSRE